MVSNTATCYIVIASVWNFKIWWKYRLIWLSLCSLTYWVNFWWSAPLLSSRHTWRPSSIIVVTLQYRPKNTHRISSGDLLSISLQYGICPVFRQKSHFLPHWTQLHIARCKTLLMKHISLCLLVGTSVKQWDKFLLSSCVYVWNCTFVQVLSAPAKRGRNSFNCLELLSMRSVTLMKWYWVN